MPAAEACLDRVPGRRRRATSTSCSSRLPPRTSCTGGRRRHWRRFYDRLAESFRADPLRQARHRRLRPPRAVPDARDAHGRPARRPRRRRALRAGAPGRRTTAATMALLFAATYPERTRALALFHPVRPLARGHERGIRRPVLAARARSSGERRSSATRCSAGICPDARLGTARRRHCGSRTRFGSELAPRSRTRSTGRWLETDLRPVLPAIRAPTLVFYREGSQYDGDHTRSSRREPHSTARASCGSPARDYWGIFLSPEIVDEIEQLRRPDARSHAEIPDTVLATLLFTDIVGSTERAAELGDRALARAARAAPCASCAASWRAFAATRRTPPATASSPRSTAPRGRSAARTSVVDGRFASSGSSSAPGSTRASASCTTTRSPGIAVSIGARVAGSGLAGREVLVSATVKDLVAGSGIRVRRARRARAEGRAGRPGSCLPSPPETSVEWFARSSTATCSSRASGGRTAST